MLFYCTAALFKFGFSSDFAVPSASIESPVKSGGQRLNLAPTIFGFFWFISVVVGGADSGEGERYSEGKPNGIPG
jgi:hypothetical protein